MKSTHSISTVNIRLAKISNPILFSSISALAIQTIRTRFTEGMRCIYIFRASISQLGSSKNTSVIIMSYYYGIHCDFRGT